MGGRQGKPLGALHTTTVVGLNSEVITPVDGKGTMESDGFTPFGEFN